MVAERIPCANSLLRTASSEFRSAIGHRGVLAGRGVEDQGWPTVREHGIELAEPASVR
jgi:hypothetical protein